MKIFYLITKSEPGGAQTHIWQLAKFFKKKGDAVAMMAYPRGWLESEIKKLGFQFYPNYFLSNNLNPFSGYKAMKEIEKAISDFKPDLLSCHSTAAGFWGRIAIKNKVPTIFTAHGWAFTKGVPFWRKILAILAEKIAAKYCSKIICVSNFDRNLALKYKIASEEKLIVIHNGVEINENQKPSLATAGRSERKERSSLRPLKSKNQNDNSKIKIVFVGRLAKPKEPILLLKAYNDLPDELKEKAEILIIGEGPKRKELEKFIREKDLKEKVKLLGSLPREQVFDVLNQCQIFVLISKWEGFPRTILEAMSCGLAIIASDIGGISEAIDSNCGILLEKNNVLEIKFALEKLLKEPTLINKLGQAAYEKVKKEFNLEKMLKNTGEIYQNIII